MESVNASLYRYVVYGCITGSQAYGLAREGSDVDRRGFFLPPADLHWSLEGLPEQLESDDERVYWEIGKFIRLALKANPNILECLFSPLVEVLEPAAEELIANRRIFLSRRVYETYSAYVLSQFKKLERDLRTAGGVKWKHAMHLIRLQLAGCSILRSGDVSLDVGAHRDRLLALRSGAIPWTEVDAWRLQLHRELEDAQAHSPLPEQPDFQRANQILLNARRAAASLDYAK
jgi:predicted nucleotidyltransferase